ncbi:6176_t:CDS:10 [Paraglomus brasilianum]|uniref:Eukaryotic translation initiation factor 3 subunit D n=1 Tax=Paraglomus brasilianum TaxID=144538 RepID=A0A9N9FE11_9GLOM|nr:6176_t:CDS:10 [Paraglomus brasilianum]
MTDPAFTSSETTDENGHVKPGRAFTLPEIIDNENGWGPSPVMLPEQFRDIPYAPYSKADKLGRIADWSTPDQREKEATGRQRAGRGYRDHQYTAYGSGVSSAFAYTHAEDEASFSVVDNRSTAQKKAQYRTTGGAKNRGGLRGQQQRQQRSNYNQFRFGVGGRHMGGKNTATAVRRRFGYKDYDKPQRIRDASVNVSPEWKLLEEIEFNRLSKLNLDVDDEEDVDNMCTERPLRSTERVRIFVTTSKDPVIEQLAKNKAATIFATDTILSVLMCATRSVYPWDIVINKTGNQLFFDRRDTGLYDLFTVNENAADPPMESADKDSINSPSALAIEAALINHCFAVQGLNEADRIEFEKSNPFAASPEEVDDMAPCAYRYRKFNLSIKAEENVTLIIRTQVDAFAKSSSGDNTMITIKALNEFDSRAQGAAGALDWRQTLDAQRGAVVATEMKNNSCKLARWAVQSILAGVDQMKLGYVSRASPKDARRHVILGTHTYKPRDFTDQMNLVTSNGWGIVRTIVDLCMKQPDGKYVLLKDPNKSAIKLYAVPLNAFEAEEEAVDEGEELEEENENTREK